MYKVVHQLYLNLLKYNKVLLEQFQADNYFTSALWIYYANISGIYYQSRNYSLVDGIPLLFSYFYGSSSMDCTFTMMFEFTFHLSCLISFMIPICVDSYFSSFMAIFQITWIQILPFPYSLSPTGTLIRHIYLPWFWTSFHFPTPWLCVFHSG